MQTKRAPSTRSTHQIPSSAKGKQILASLPRVDIHSETIKLVSDLNLSTGTEDVGNLTNRNTQPEMTDVVGEKLPNELNRSSGDRPVEAPWIPPVSCERN